ncbi:MAG: hypothetical protein R3218_08010 [Christiangramia sp.]|nr:hypothetical protein [Christiangramia sp.]
MKPGFPLFLFGFLTIFQFSYSQDYVTYADSLGNIINEDKFKEQLDGHPTRRYIIQDSVLVKQIINTPFWETKTGAYNEAKNQIENITGTKYPGSTIFLISYILHNDYCHSLEDQNKWNGVELKEIYDRFSPQVRNAERRNKNLKVIYLFQDELALADIKQKKKIFYKDRNNNFKNSFLTNPATCGHKVLIKPSGEMLIKNGEYPIEWMAKEIKGKNWEIYFPGEQTK